MEDDQELQEAVLTAYHQITIMFEMSPGSKSILTNTGRAWVDSTEVETKMIVAPAEVISTTVRFDMDYYTVRIGSFEGGEHPSSYGGMSGGPLFATRENATMSERILMGVMYRQSDVDENGDRTISCHGFSSIYDLMCPMITIEFADPSEFMRLNNLNADGSPA